MSNNIKYDSYKITVYEDSYTIIIYTGSDRLDSSDDNVDVEVVKHSSERYSATLFTLENVKNLMSRYKQTGENKNGSYFWASDILLVHYLSIDNIREIVRSIIEENSLEQIFKKLGDS